MTTERRTDLRRYSYTIGGKNALNPAKMAGKLRIRPIDNERLKREAESLRKKGEQAVSDADYRRLFQNVPTLDDDALRDLFVESTPRGQILPQSGDCTQDGHLPHF